MSGMSVFLSLLRHLAGAFCAMLLLLAVVAAVTQKWGAGAMAPVLLLLAVADLGMAALAVWHFCRPLAGSGGAVWVWGVAAGVLMLFVLAGVALFTLIATNR